MNVDFFDESYRTEEARNDKEFGICDPKPEEHKPAYTTTEEDGPHKWCAQVNNAEEKSLLFIPIDNNIVFKDDKGNKESTCDGLLVDSEMHDYLCFVELKDVRKNWISKAVSQLRETILKFNSNHDYTKFNKRLAHACNRKIRRIGESRRELQQQFRHETHFALVLNYNIDILMP